VFLAETKQPVVSIVEEIKTLERTIGDLLSGFQERTGLAISHVRIRSSLKYPHLPKQGVEVRIEIEVPREEIT
jgi:hypothetical protein